MRIPRRALLAGAAGAAAMGLALAGAASADPICTTLTPAAGDTITCSYFSSGKAVIIVPPGTSALAVTAKGGGGAGGARVSSFMWTADGSAGGAGAKAVAFLNPSSLSAISVTVGRGGLGGARGGMGGDHSAVYAGVADLAGQAMVVAGGGGGGAEGSDPGHPWVGGEGAVAGGAAGGDGTATALQPESRGRGGAGGTGGLGISSCSTALPGYTEPGATWASGGAGGASSPAGGAGGSGYGGGGGGCDAGGGAGGSLAAPAYLNGDATFSPEGGPGGAGGTAPSPNGAAGGHGQVQITFIAMSFALTYVPNGATGGAVPQDSGANWIYDAPVTVPDNSGGLVRPGYAFAGWNTAADGSGTSYPPGATITMRQAVTLYAQWALAAPESTAPGAGQAASSPTGAAPRTRLAGRFALRKGVGTTTGTVPPGATVVVQTVGGGGGTTGFLEMAKAKAKTAKGKCRITTVRNKKTRKVTKRTYRCTIRLSKGTWTVTTTARGTAGVVAESSRRVVVR